MVLDDRYFSVRLMRCYPTSTALSDCRDVIQPILLSPTDATLSKRHCSVRLTRCHPPDTAGFMAKQVSDEISSNTSGHYSDSEMDVSEELHVVEEHKKDGCRAGKEAEAEEEEEEEERETYMSKNNTIKWSSVAYYKHCRVIAQYDDDADVDDDGDDDVRDIRRRRRRRKWGITTTATAEANLLGPTAYAVASAHDIVSTFHMFLTPDRQNCARYDKSGGFLKVRRRLERHASNRLARLYRAANPSRYIQVPRRGRSQSMGCGER